MTGRTDILPAEHFRPVGGGGLAWLVVLTIAFVVGTNFAAAEFLGRVTINGGYALARGKWLLMDRAIADRKKIDALIVGDSSSNQGIDPAVIYRETKQRALNLGVVAEAHTTQPVWTVRRFFENVPKKNRPKAVYWMHVYDIWSRPDPRNRRLMGISAALPPTAWPQIEKGPRVRFSVDDLKWRRMMPLWAQATSMQLLIRRPIDSLTQAGRFRFDENGFTAEREPDPALVADDTRDHIESARKGGDPSPNAQSRDAMNAMAKLSEKYGFDLWIVESPINESLWRDERFRKRWFEVHASLVDFAAKHPRVRVAFDEPVRIADARMQNSDHVLADAAADFTSALVARTRTPTTVPSPP